MPFVSRPGARIHYSTHGAADAPAVVLIQGLGLSSRFWFDIPERLATDEVTRRHVITIDNRGTGKSGRPRPPWTMRTMADDVAAVLDDARVEKAIIAGVSMGGMIAQHVALRHPSRAEALLLLATSPGFPAGTPPEVRVLLRLFSHAFGGEQGEQGKADLASILIPESKWHHAKELFREWALVVRDDPTPRATIAAHLFAASTHFVTPWLARIDCPVLVVAGTDDVLIPKRNAEALVRLIPNAELELVPDTGHALFIEDRDLVRRMIARLEQTVS